MSAPSVALLLTLAFRLSVAMPWTGPSETKVYRGEEYSPRPTSAPEHVALLSKRDSLPVNVCGWVGGRAESVVRCGSGSSCIHETMFGVVGCCATAGPCTDGVFTTCIDSGNSEWQSTPGMINNGVLSCGVSSTCYQNVFPAGYKQFSCGESSTGDGTVQTTYDGQATEMRLQVVYTGIRFSPMSRPALQTVPLIPEPTSSDGTSSTGTTQGTDASNGPDETTGYIAGGTIGGVALAAILIAGLVLFLRRRKRRGPKIGGVVNFLQRPAPPPPSGALKRLTKLYSPHDFGPLPRRTTAQDDAYMSQNSGRDASDLEPVAEANGSTTYISPLTAPQTREHHIIVDRDLLMLNSPMSASTVHGEFPEMDGYDSSYAGVPISRLNVHHHNSGPNSQNQSPQLLPADDLNAQQRQPLVGIQIDDFGSGNRPTRTWARGIGEYASINHQTDEDTHIHSGHMPEMTDIGLIGTMRRAASQMVMRKGRTQDKNARSESMRQSNPFSDENAIDDSVWKSTPMNAPVLKEPEGFGLGLGFGSDNWGALLGSSSNSGDPSGSGSTGRNQTSNQEPNEGEKPRVERPLMEQMMEAFNAATRGVGHRSSPSISSASAATRHGGMYALPEETADGSVSDQSSLEGGGAGGGSDPSVSTATLGIVIERPTMLTRGQSSASLLRKPVGRGFAQGRGHRPTRSDV